MFGPIFAGLLAGASDGGERELVHYQEAFQPLMYGVGVSIFLTFLLRETGPAVSAAIATKAAPWANGRSAAKH